MTLVAKRWHASFYAERSLWRMLSISVPPRPPAALGWQCSSAADPLQTALWCDSMERRLQRVGGMVEHASVAWDRSATDAQLARLLQRLDPGTLSGLNLLRCDRPTEEPWPPAAPLQRFPGLQYLHLG